MKNLKGLMKNIQVLLKVDLTTRFNGKMFLFSKVSVKSFAYDLIDVFMLPIDDIKDAVFIKI